MSAISVGQLRRWTWPGVPAPAGWHGSTLLIVAKRIRRVDREGVQHASCDFLIDGQLESDWRDDDIALMSEVIDAAG